MATILNRTFLVIWLITLGPVWLFGVCIQRAGKYIAIAAAWPLSQMAEVNRGDE